MHAFRRLLTLGLILAGLPLATEGALSRQNNLLGKFFVSSVNGAVTCVSDGRILELKKGDTIIARGAILETGEKSNVTLVFSNGTGVYTDEKTRFEIEKFDQEFFAPNNNLRVEPSNSSTIVKLATGRVVISTPRLLSGTTMVYETAHAMVGIRGEKLLIEATEKQTHVAIIGGNATVNPRGADGQFVSIGKRLVTGQEAFVKYTLGGQAITEEEFVASSGGEASAASSPSTSAPAAAPAPITRQVEAVVLRLTGSARVKLPADPREHDLAEGEKLPQGTLLRTGETDEVHLQPFEGAIATVRPNSTVHLEKLSVTDEAGVTTKQSALLALTAGTIISTIDPAKKDINDYGVRTPKGIANAKGTSFAVSVEDDGFSVTTTADTVTFVTPEGATYSIAAGNVSITPPGGEPQPPVSLIDAMAGNSGFAQVVQTALSTVATVVQNNLGSLSPSSATDLLTKVAHTATAALPGEATAIATKVVAAVTWPASATSSQSAAAVAAVTSAIVAAAPDQAAQIATSAALAAPTQAVAVSAGAAKSSPGQAAQIASAVTQTFVQTTPDGDVSPASVQTAAAVAAAVTNSAPNQAAPIAAAVMQALAQAAPLSTPLSNSQHAATIASAVTNAAPPQAVPVAALMMKTLTQTPTFSEATQQVVAQAAATLAAAVTTVVPPQAQEVATAVMQLLVQTYPNASPAATTQTAGLIAAAVAQVAPGDTAAITQSVALAANQPLVSVQAAAIQSAPLASQVAQQVSLVTQAANAATQQSSSVIASLNGPAPVPVSSGAPAPSGTPGTTNLPGAVANSTDTPPPAAENTSTSIIVTQFDPGSVDQLTADLEAAQAAQTTVQFSTNTTGNGGNSGPVFGGGGNQGNGGNPGDEPGVQPIPTVPFIPPVEFTVSAANVQ